MMLFGPAEVTASNGIVVDAQGFVTLPNNANGVPFRVTKEALVGGPPHKYRIQINDAGVKDIYNADK